MVVPDSVTFPQVFQELWKPTSSLGRIRRIKAGPGTFISKIQKPYLTVLPSGVFLNRSDHYSVGVHFLRGRHDR